MDHGPAIDHRWSSTVLVWHQVQCKGSIHMRPWTKLFEMCNKISTPLSKAVPPPPAHTVTPSSVLKRHHSLPHQQPRSVDNLRAAGGPISSRTRRSQVPGQVGQVTRQYETPDEEEELLDEALTGAHKAMKRLDRNSIQPDTRPSLRQSNSNLGLTNPYPTPSPSASGNAVLFGHGVAQGTPSKVRVSNKQSSTPPYDEENEWGASAAASIFAAQNRF